MYRLHLILQDLKIPVFEMLFKQQKPAYYVKKNKKIWSYCRQIVGKRHELENQNFLLGMTKVLDSVEMFKTGQFDDLDTEFVEFMKGHENQTDKILRVILDFI